jgi:diacylglycerol kinase family enzyme
MSSHLAIILNHSSGMDGKEAVQMHLARFFDSHGVEARIMRAHRSEQLIELAQRAVSDNADPVVASGGDGTINAVASVLVGTERTLGVLPLGTLNHFAKDLKIPLALEESAITLIEGQVVTIDVGEVNGHLFLNNSSLGLYPGIVRHREKLQERLGYGKWPAFLWAALLILRRYPFLEARLCTDHSEIERQTPFIFIGNNEYQLEGLDIGTRARMDASRLYLYTTRYTGRLGLLRFAYLALSGGLRNDKDFDVFRTQEIVIRTKRSRLHVATDGEVTVMQTPLYYRIRPRALRVLVPRQQPGLGENEG